MGLSGAKEVLRRSGTTAEHAAFTGAASEITYDSDKKSAIVHDGVTAGGFEAAHAYAEIDSRFKNAYYVKNAASVTDHSSAGQAGSIAAILATIGSNDAVMVLPDGDYPILGTVNFPANVEVVASYYSRFSGVGTVNFGNAKKNVVSAMNMDAILDDGSGFAVDLHLNGFYSDGDGGGGSFYWDSGQAKSGHDGGVIIDPAHTASPGASAWYSPVGAGGSGCWVRRIDQCVTPKMFGAKIDGTTDDRLSCQGALNTGQRVYFHGGTYLLDVQAAPSGVDDDKRTLRPSSNQTVELSENAILQVKTSSDPYYAVFTLGNDGMTARQDVENVVIRGGTLLGDRDTHGGETTPTGFGVLIRPGSSNVRVENVTANDFWGDGFYVGGATQFAADDEPKNIAFSGCVGTNNRRQGLSVTRADGVVVDGCFFSGQNGNSPEAGIDVEMNSGQTPLRNVVISNTTCRENDGAGIAGYKCENINVVNCFAIENGAEGIEIENISGHNSVTGCTVYDNATAGVNCAYTAGGGRVEDLICSDNHVFENGGIGIRIYGITRRISVSGNVVTLNDNHGIYIDGDGTYNPDHFSVIGNICEANSQDADDTYDNIRIGSNALRGIVANNTIKAGDGISPTGAGAKYGIYVESSSNILVSNNHAWAGGVTGNIAYTGTGNNLLGNYAYPMGANLSSASFSVASGTADSYGSQLTVAHGLPYTPTVGQIGLSVLSDDGVDIAVIPYVKAIDGTNVYIVPYIVQDAGAASKTAKIGVSISEVLQ